MGLTALTFSGAAFTVGVLIAARPNRVNLVFACFRRRA
jgi:hypothetical protein